MKNKKLSISHVGTSLVLVVLIILALVVFAVLSLSQTNRDRLYAEKIVSLNQAYRKACDEAEETLSDIDRILLDNWQEDRQAWYRAAESALSGLDDLSLDFSSETPSISFQVAYGSDRALCVTLEIAPPSGDDQPFYRITRWQEISTRDWQADNTLNLL